MRTSKVEPSRHRHRRPRARVITWVTLIAVALVAASCSSDDDATPTTATSAEEGSTTTAAPSLVLEGTFSAQDEILEMPDGFTNSVAMEGDLVGQGVFLGTATPEGESWRIEGDWAYNLSSPELGEGLVAVQNWVATVTPDGQVEGTGDVIGVSGDFTDLIGTTSATGSEAEGTYVMELQPGASSPEPAEPTETRTIETDDTSVAAWTTCDPETLLCTAESAFGGGTTTTGDIVGSSGWTGNISSAQTISINVGTLDGEGDGVFITVSPLNPAETYTVPVEFFGVSGAFAGLAGEGTATVTTRDATGALAPTSASTIEVSR